MIRYKKGDWVRIKSIPSFKTIPGVLEFVDCPFVVETVFNDLDDGQGIELIGIPYMLTSDDIEPWR